MSVSTPLIFYTRTVKTLSIRYKDENGNWVTGNKAIETSIVDQSGNFESDNVEGALRELADKVAKNSDIVNIEAMAKANS